MEMKEIKIFEAKEAMSAYLEGINGLLPQLLPSAQGMTMEELQEMVDKEDTHLVLAEDENGRIVGMCTVAVYRIPTGRKAWLEDVVVDESARGMRLGWRLVEKAKELADSYAPCTMMLTSRPSRVAANGLYQAAGFETKVTNVYQRGSEDGRGKREERRC